MKQCNVISVASQKGGIGKTTTVINLASALSKNHNVLIIDMDSQADTSFVFDFTEKNTQLFITDILKRDYKKNISQEELNYIYSGIYKTEYDNLYIMPSNLSLADFDVEISVKNRIAKELILRKVINNIRNEFDYIFIDCPPSLGFLTINALCASDYVLIPLSTKIFSIKALQAILDIYNLIKDNLNENLEILGVLINNYEGRSNVDKEIYKTLEEKLKDKLFNTKIRKNIQLEYAYDAKKPIIFFNENCNAYNDFIELSKEVKEKLC